MHTCDYMCAYQSLFIYTDATRRSHRCKDWNLGAAFPVDEVGGSRRNDDRERDRPSFAAASQAMAADSHPAQLVPCAVGLTLQFGIATRCLLTVKTDEWQLKTETWLDPKLSG